MIVKVWGIKAFKQYTRCKLVNGTLSVICTFSIPGLLSGWTSFYTEQSFCQFSAPLLFTYCCPVMPFRPWTLSSPLRLLSRPGLCLFLLSIRFSLVCSLSCISRKGRLCIGLWTICPTAQKHLVICSFLCTSLSQI